MPAKGFHDLPLELRDEIYRYCSPEIALLTLLGGKSVKVERDGIIHTDTSSEAVIQERLGDGPWYSAKGLPILHLDRKIRAEALALMYKECTFAIVLSAEKGLSEGFFGNKVAQDYFLGKCQRPYWKHFLLPEPVFLIRNWLIVLSWHTSYLGNSQPTQLRQQMQRAVDVLCQSTHIDTATIECPCHCSFFWGGFEALDVSGGGFPTTYCRRAFESESTREIAAMLDSLPRLNQVAKAIVLASKVFMQTEYPPFQQYACVEDYCHAQRKQIMDLMENGKSFKVLTGGYHESRATHS
ncbi:MAG: hypothetical protein Q9181_007449 [Wetmoreana brouardii]